MKRILYFIFIIVAFVACDKQSSHILSSSKMEDVLYDYHLAQGMLEGLNSTQREEMAQAYIDAVFEKHKITEAEFDSSMVWYNRHTETLNEIYENLQERYTEANQELALTTGNEVMTVFSENGDTTNIWNGSPLSILRSKGGLNYENFTIPADSSFHRKDKFILVCTPILLNENGDNRDNYINIGMTITYKDGKTTGATMRSNATRDIQLNLPATEDKDIASVSTFFYYNAKGDYRNIALVSNIGLVRMRTIEATPKTEVTDSIKTDSIITVEPEMPHERLTPEQIRMKQQNNNRIKIKTAPDVRTPNSIGPRRRTNRPRSVR